MNELSEVFDLTPGRAPVLVAMPHLGIGLPEALMHRFSAEALVLPDTDWHVDALYGAAAELGCSVLKARLSRYVVDLNRPPDDAPMYPGSTNTGLVPTETFDGAPLYRPDQGPRAEEAYSRLALYWRPYHEALQAELDRLRQRHGFALLWDAHSIRSRVPRLFEGVLPDLNFGTHDGRSCDPALSRALMAEAAREGDYGAVLDARFKGGYTTRHYGQPQHGIHAVQLEVTQRCYLKAEKPPFALSAMKSARFGKRIGDLLGVAAAWRPRA